MLARLDGEGPLFRQAYRALRAEILARRLAPGSRLPATRVLADELGVSRNTALQAYRLLLDEGYVRARQGSGTYVAEILPEERVEAPRTRPARTAETGAVALRLSERAERSLARVPPGIVWGVPRRRLEYDFRYGEPCFGDLPLETWWRLSARRARRATAAQLAYGPAAGALELRQALADYLGRARGVRGAAEQIVIVNGTQQAIDLAVRVLVNEGDRVALEEPHYTGFAHALAAQGAEIVSVPVDDDGLDVAGLERERDVRGAFVTPSHQFPTGGILPLARRMQLLGWAARERAFLVEDDYDGEYRYDGRPIPCLQGLDERGCVLYVGSTSKLLFPALRVGWLVLPESLAGAFAQAKALADTGSATLEQLVLADFIAGGHLERHVRRTRARNAARREALAAAVAEHLAGAATLAGVGAGLHGLLWVPSLAAGRELELRKRCARLGVGIYPVLPFYREPPACAGFVLGFSALEPEAIDAGVRRIARALDALAR